MQRAKPHSIDVNLDSPYNYVGLYSTCVQLSGSKVIYIAESAIFDKICLQYFARSI